MEFCGSHIHDSVCACVLAPHFKLFFTIWYDVTTD